MMLWLDKKWLFDVFSGHREVDFNNFRKVELVQILNCTRLYFWYLRYENNRDK